MEVTFPEECSRWLHLLSIAVIGYYRQLINKSICKIFFNKINAMVKKKKLHIMVLCHLMGFFLNYILIIKLKKGSLADGFLEV